MSISIGSNPAEHLTLLPFFPTYSTSVTPTHAHRHPLSRTLIYCRASPPYCPVTYLYSLSHTFSELSLRVIITWSVDEAPRLILLDKIVQSEGSEMDGGKICVRGPFSPVRTTVLVLCVWTAGAAHSNDSFSALSFLWHNHFYWLFMCHWSREVIFLTTFLCSNDIEVKMCSNRMWRTSCCAANCFEICCNVSKLTSDTGIIV